MRLLRVGGRKRLALVLCLPLTLSLATVMGFIPPSEAEAQGNTPPRTAGWQFGSIGSEPVRASALRTALDLNSDLPLFEWDAVAQRWLEHDSASRATLHPGTGVTYKNGYTYAPTITEGGGREVTLHSGWNILAAPSELSRNGNTGAFMFDDSLTDCERNTGVLIMVRLQSSAKGFGIELPCQPSDERRLTSSLGTYDTIPLIYQYDNLYIYYRGSRSIKLEWNNDQKYILSSSDTSDFETPLTEKESSGENIPEVPAVNVYGNCAILEDGRVKCWGGLRDYYLGVHKELSEQDFQDYIQQQVEFFQEIRSDNFISESEFKTISEAHVLEAEEIEISNVSRLWGTSTGQENKDYANLSGYRNRDVRCAIHFDGGVSCWGIPIDDGELSTRRAMRVPGVSGIVDIAFPRSVISYYGFYFLKSDGTVLYGTLFGEKTKVPGVENAVAMSTFELSDMGGPVFLTSDGRVLYRVHREFPKGRFADPDYQRWSYESESSKDLDYSRYNISEIVELPGISTAVSIKDSCAVLDSGAVKCWIVTTDSDEPLFYSPTCSTDISKILRTDFRDDSLYRMTVALTKDGNLVFSYDYIDHNFSTILINTEPLREIAVGNILPLRPFLCERKSGISNAIDYVGSLVLDEGCAVIADGTVRCWGTNFFGELGIGKWSQSFSKRTDQPVQVLGIDNAVSIVGISGQAGQACALLADGGVKCWGLNCSGEVGNGDRDTHCANAAHASTGGVYLYPNQGVATPTRVKGL